MIRVYNITMELKLAKLDNYDEFYKLKSDKSNIYWTGWSNSPDYEKLKEFYYNVINNLKTIKDRRIYLAYENDEVVGYVYIDYVDDDTFALSPAVHSKFQGKGYGKQIIGLGIKEGLNLGYRNMEAYIREDNIVSQKCFEYNGAHKTEEFKNLFIENLNKEIKMIKYYYESK